MRQVEKLERAALRAIQPERKIEVIPQLLSEIANAWAAEHLLLLVGDDARAGTLASLHSVGTVFVGASS